MACSVVLLHTTVNTPWLASSPVRNSYIAVDFFFILSGFVICMNYADKLEQVVDLKKYVIKRFLRLWPLHLNSLLFLSFLDFIAFRFGLGADTVVFSDIVSFAKELVLLHVFMPEVGMHWNFPAWSISAEIVAYLVFAFLVFGLGNRFIYGLAAVFILSFFSVFCEIDTKALRATTGFCLGAMIAELFFRRRIYEYRFPSILEVPALLLLFTIFAFYKKLGGIAYPVMLMSFTAVVTIFAFEAGPISSALKAWPFQKLGLYSYGIYMVHSLIMKLIDKLISVLEKVIGVPMRVISPFPDFREGKLLLDSGSFFMNSLLPIGILLLVIITARVSNKIIEIPWIKKAKEITSSVR